jgi:hypothetical protein
MPNEHGKSIDKTFLSLDLAEERGFLHRDYLAHCLRWSHVVKFLQEKKRYQSSYVLDLGCGKEAPLLKTLYSSRLLPMFYVGVDYGPIIVADKIQSLRKYMATNQVQLVPNTNILELDPIAEEDRPDIIVMFEALEHMEKPMGIDVLAHIYAELMGDNTTFFMSTPCYDGHNKAGNHVYEWTYIELFTNLQDAGFKIKGHWGTFASLKDYAHLLPPTMQESFNELRAYYDVNMLACVFAPLFPAQSRNCLWQLTK